MEDVVVFAALGWEARAALDALQGVEALGPRVWRGYLGDGAGVRVLQIGVGLERAERAVAAAAAAGLYVSCGCAGALLGGLHAGDLVLGDRVVPLDRDGRALGEIPLDARPLATFSAARGIPVRVSAVASSPVMLASADAKREAARYGAAVVEMESAAVVRMARERGVACTVVKVVLDEAHDAVGFPGAEVVDAETGEVDVARAARSLAMRPDWWLRAARLARRQRIAERRLREYLAVVFSAGLQALGRGPRTVGSVPNALVG
jgi:nucleoside phosphorylase